MSEVALSTIPGWTDEHIARLARSWISTADQVVAVGVTSGGVHSLAEQVGVSDEEMQRLIGLARIALGPEARAAMSQRVDSDDRGLGAIEQAGRSGTPPERS